MTNISMTLWQVKKARRLVWEGRSVAAVAAEMRLNYSPVYWAVTGKTWCSVQDPPSVPSVILWIDRQRPLRFCGNCGRRYYRGGTTRRCGACYAHLNRHGKERILEHLNKPARTRISRPEIDRLYKRYQAGNSLESLAANLPFSAETLRRRFSAAGFAIRPCTGLRQKLTPGIVCQARELHYQKGVLISHIAIQLGVNYQTLYTAVMGYTWRSAGGPLSDGDGEKRPCRRCEILTGHQSGLCRYCR